MTAQPLRLDPDLLLQQSSWLRRLAARLVEDPDRADDLLQDAWVTALERPPSRLTDETGLRAWLATVVRNRLRTTARRSQRAEARERAVARPDRAPSLEESMERVEAQRALVDAVVSLDEPDRAVVVLRYFENLPPRAIAEQLGLSGPAVRSRLSRALDKLRARLDTGIAGLALLAPPAKPVGDAGQITGTAATSSGVAVAGATAVLAATAGVKLVGVITAVAAAVALFVLLPLDSGASSPAPTPPGTGATPPLVDTQPEPAAPEQSNNLDTNRTAVEAPAPTRTDVDKSTYALVARFINARGAPLAGARLTVPGARKGGFAQADDDGRVRIELGWPYRGRTVGAGKIELKAGGDRLATYSWYAKREGPGVQDLGEIRLQPGGAVTGRVVDRAGRPVAEANMSVTAGFEPKAATEIDQARTFRTNVPGLGAGMWLRSSTAADGTFRLDGVPATTISVWASQRGALASYTKPIELRAGATVQVGDIVIEPLPPENQITGIVLDGDGQPLPGIVVQFGGDDLYQLEGYMIYTGDNGRFAVTVMRNGEYTLVFSRGDGVPGGIKRPGLAAGTRGLEIRFASERWLEIAPEASDGTRVVADSIQVTDADNYVVHAEVKTDAQGIQRLRVPDGTFYVQLYTRGWKSKAKRGPFEPTTAPDPLVFSMRRATGISGRVMAAGAPVAGAKVHAHFATRGGRGAISDDGFHARFDGRVRGVTTTDAEGKFFVQLLRSDNYTLHAEADGHARGELGPLEYVDGRNLTGTVLKLRRGGSIEGRVLTAPGVSAAGTIVGVGNGDTHFTTVKVGEDGAYCFDNLSPGQWQVLACNENLLNRLTSGTFLHAAPSAAVVWSTEVQARQVTHYDLDRRDRVPSSVRGVVRLDGAPPTGWRCSLVGQGDWEYGTVDADGRFELRSPSPGEHKLYVFGPRGSVRVSIVRPIELHAGPNDWRLDIATGSVTLTDLPTLMPTRDADQEPPHYALRWRTPDGALWLTAVHSADAGALTVAPVPAGRVTLIRRPDNVRHREPDDNWPVVQELTVVAGTEQRVSVR